MGVDNAVRKITIHRTKHEWTPRTKEQIEAIMAFWWKLQTYRRRFLERQGLEDTAEEVLSETDISRVRRDWEDEEMWPDLTKKQREEGHPPSIYNAALNNKSGWALVANGIITYQLPQLEALRKIDPVTDHIRTINWFCWELLDWMKKNIARPWPIGDLKSMRKHVLPAHCQRYPDGATEHLCPNKSRQPTQTFHSSHMGTSSRCGATIHRSIANDLWLSRNALPATLS